MTDEGAYFDRDPRPVSRPRPDWPRVRQLIVSHAAHARWSSSAITVPSVLPRRRGRTLVRYCPRGPLALRSVADLLARHEAGQDQRCRPRDRDRVQANDQPEAFDLAGDADHGGQDVDRSQPVNDRQPEDQLSAITAEITAAPRR